MHITNNATGKAQCQASIVQCAQNLIEIAPTVVVGMSKRKDWRSFVS